MAASMMETSSSSAKVLERAECDHESVSTYSVGDAVGSVGTPVFVKVVEAKGS
jgi:hypothetical protein